MSKTLSPYAQKLRDPRWQKRRLEIFQRDEFACRFCGCNDQELHCHHKRYKPNTEPWDYPDENFLTLCWACHQAESSFRKEVERKLLDALHSLDFSTHDVDNLAEFFSSGDFKRLHYINDVAINVMHWASDNNAGEKYFESISNRTAA